MPSKAQIRPSARRFCAALGGRLERTKCWSGANEPAVAGTVRPALDGSATRKTHANALQLCGVRRVEASVDAQGAMPSPVSATEGISPCPAKTSDLTPRIRCPRTMLFRHGRVDVQHRLNALLMQRSKVRESNGLTRKHTAPPARARDMTSSLEKAVIRMVGMLWP